MRVRIRKDADGAWTVETKNGMSLSGGIKNVCLVMTQKKEHWNMLVCC